ncbi:hypothetical protein Tco_0714384 [Tanacetum coccineum]
MKDTPYELIMDDQKKQLGKKNEAKITPLHTLPVKSPAMRILQVGVFMCLKSLDQDYSCKNYVRKFLCALLLKWRAKVYEMILKNDGVASKTTKEKVKSLALKAKVTREQTSDNSDSQRGSDEDVDKEEAEAFNLMARNFPKVLPQG